MKKSFRSISFYIILPIIIIILMMVSLDDAESEVKTFTDLAGSIKNKEVTNLEIGDSVTVAKIKDKTYELTDKGRYT